MAAINYDNSSIKVDNITVIGQQANEIFTEDLYSIDIVRQNAINVMPNVKGRTQLLAGKVKAWFEKYTCEWKNTTEATMSEKWIDTEVIDLGGQFCYGEFYQTWLSDSMNASINHGTEVPPFTEWLFRELRKEMARAYQKLFWRGDTASNDKTLKAVDGIEKKLLASNDVTKITGSAFTVANVLAQVEAAILQGIALANAAEIDTDEFKVYMNHADIKTLNMALGKLCCDVQDNRIFNNYTKEGDTIYIYGFPVIPTMQTASSVIFAPEKSLHLATDIFDAHTTYKVIDMRESTLDDICRWRCIASLGTGILFDSVIVYSHV